MNAVAFRAPHPSDADVRPPPRLLTALTRREAQILEQIWAGRSNKEIGAALHLGEDGVKYHIKSIHAKLGAKRRTDALRIASEFGLLGSGLRSPHSAATIVPAGGHHRRLPHDRLVRCAHCGR